METKGDLYFKDHQLERTMIIKSEIRELNTMTGARLFLVLFTKLLEHSFKSQKVIDSLPRNGVSFSIKYVNFCHPHTNMQ